ncbi:D-serine ammonia-lyase [Halobacillus litoralis]|uniref:Probable D-serine dehydratase n=1 Tax=Halobacillus litoralis TaxID=45668 RepID=A0A845E264_9BACI|nr:D-serine ammonia-lyase [Halobacillus litoralis]MYL48296.1 D-serine ammonia-lyase [Halobacillus litoralis]
MFPESTYSSEKELIDQLKNKKETFWSNESLKPYHTLDKNLSIPIKDLHEAENLFHRFTPYLAKVFPETKKINGIIESPIRCIPSMQQELEKRFQQSIPGHLYVKCDHELPIAGSIKARGGIYEVLKYAEGLAIKHGKLTKDDDYSKLANPEFRQFFSNFSIAVGSTGNLALSIGIMSAVLGFQVTVHMSVDAKEWKKDLLRDKGVVVVEHDKDFSFAVNEGRRRCQEQKNCYFIDDENSKDLFLGYAVAALRLHEQLKQENISVDADHPLVVYLPCGVGGGPAGITYGLKYVFGDHVHCYFAEPTSSPCMMLGLVTGKHEDISVQDIGLDNKTEADGLAVGRPSALAGRLVENMVNGIYTINDENLYKLLALLHESEGISLEPSALAGMYGPSSIDIQNQLDLMYGSRLSQATHLVWATGGSLVPKDIMEGFVSKGTSFLRQDE